MPTFSKKSEAIVRELGGKMALTRDTGETIASPVAATPLVNAGVLVKATVKPPGGSQSTVYWLTDLGRRMFAGLRRRCRICGCSEYNACTPPCAWIEADLCSALPCMRKAGYKRIGHDWRTPDGALFRPDMLPASYWKGLTRESDKAYRALCAELTVQLRARRRGGKRETPGGRRRAGT